MKVTKLTYAHIKDEISKLLAVNPHRRPLSLPVVAALSSGLPLFIGVYFGHFEYGLLSSIGAMSFLYLPQTALIHRMVTLLCVVTLLTASFSVGLVAYHFPAFLVLLITVLTIIITMLCRYFNIAPPGNFFFLMAAMIAAYIPHQIEQIPTLVGLVFLGGLFACVLGFAYSLFMLWQNNATPSPPPINRDIKLVIVDALIIGIFVGFSLFLANLFAMPKPYWVPVSCAAVMQGITFRAVWTKQAHRLMGTGVGLGLTWLLLWLNPQSWWLCLLMMSLSFIIEILIVKHYALAVIFITPLTIFLAEAGGGSGVVSISELIHSRFFDTLLGCFMGLLGAASLHFLGLRNWLERYILKLSQHGKSI